MCAIDTRVYITRVSVRVCAGVNLRRFPAASRLGGEPRRAGAGSLPHSCTPFAHLSAHTDTHRDHTAPFSAPCRAARAGADSKGRSGLRHCRSEALAASCSRVGHWAVCGFLLIFFFPDFVLALSRVHTPLPTGGSSRALAQKSQGSRAGPA